MIKRNNELRRGFTSDDFTEWYIQDNEKAFYSQCMVIPRDYPKIIKNYDELEYWMGILGNPPNSFDTKSEKFDYIMYFIEKYIYNIDILNIFKQLSEIYHYDFTIDIFPHDKFTAKEFIELLNDRYISTDKVLGYFDNRFLAMLLASNKFIDFCIGELGLECFIAHHVLSIQGQGLYKKVSDLKLEKLDNMNESELLNLQFNGRKLIYKGKNNILYFNKFKIYNSSLFVNISKYIENVNDMKLRLGNKYRPEIVRDTNYISPTFLTKEQIEENDIRVLYYPHNLNISNEYLIKYNISVLPRIRYSWNCSTLIDYIKSYILFLESDPRLINRSVIRELTTMNLSKVGIKGKELIDSYLKNDFIDIKYNDLYYMHYIIYNKDCVEYKLTKNDIVIISKINSNELEFILYKFPEDEGLQRSFVNLIDKYNNKVANDSNFITFKERL